MSWSGKSGKRFLGEHRHEEGTLWTLCGAGHLLPVGRVWRQADVQSAVGPAADPGDERDTEPRIPMGVGHPAVAGAASTVIFTSGSVSDIDKTEKALAVEKLIYAFEANKGEINDLSFVDGYVKGKVDNHTVTAHIYTRRDGVLDINVRATKYLISNSKVAQKVIDKYRNYVR